MWAKKDECGYVVKTHKVSLVFLTFKRVKCRGKQLALRFLNYLNAARMQQNYFTFILFLNNKK